MTWTFEFLNGTMEVPSSRVSGAERRAKLQSLRIVTAPDDASPITATLDTTAVVHQVEVPGGDNYYIDPNPNDRNTIEITVPEELRGYVLGGEHVVTSWSVEPAYRDLVRVSLDVWRTRPIDGFGVNFGRDFGR